MKANKVLLIGVGLATAGITYYLYNQKQKAITAATPEEVKQTEPVIAANAASTLLTPTPAQQANTGINTGIKAEPIRDTRLIPFDAAKSTATNYLQRLRDKRMGLSI